MDFSSGTNDGVTDIDSFGVALEGWPNGCHPIPHTLIGGLQGDIPASPSDCWFWFHHANLDRFWLFWASIDWWNRWNKIGTAEAYANLRNKRQCESSNYYYHYHTPADREPGIPAKPITMDSIIHLSDAFPDYRVGDVFSPTGGPFCYVYE